MSTLVVLIFGLLIVQALVIGSLQRRVKRLEDRTEVEL